MIAYLIPPFVDDWHVDIVYKNRHFLPSRRSVRGPHPLIHIALYRSLPEKNGVGSERGKTTNIEMKEAAKSDGERKDRSAMFHSDIIHGNSLINVRLSHVQRNNSRPPPGPHMINQSRHGSILFSS